LYVSGIYTYVSGTHKEVTYCHCVIVCIRDICICVGDTKADDMLLSCCCASGRYWINQGLISYLPKALTHGASLLDYTFKGLGWSHLYKEGSLPLDGTTSVQTLASTHPSRHLLSLPFRPSTSTKLIPWTLGLWTRAPSPRE